MLGKCRTVRQLGRALRLSNGAACGTWRGPPDIDAMSHHIDPGSARLPNFAPFKAAYTSFPQIPVHSMRL